MNFKIYFLFIFIFLLMQQCRPKLDEFTPQTEQVNFESYLSVGNSLAAGFYNGALYQKAQEYSFPNILAHQLTYVGRKGEFKQPYLDYPDGIGVLVDGLDIEFTTRLTLKRNINCLGIKGLKPEFIDPAPPQELLFEKLYENISARGPFNNQAVPGMRIIDIVKYAFGLENPYFYRMTKHPILNSPIENLRAIKPSFFSVFLGSNDVLIYASSGGTSSEITPLEGLPGKGFKASYEVLLDTLRVIGNYKSGKLQGILCTIPSITYAAYFNSVKPDILQITDPNIIQELNKHYARYNYIMDSLNLPYHIEFKLGNNLVIIDDPNIKLPDAFKNYHFRPITSTEKLLLPLPQDSIFCSNWGSIKPIPDLFTLRQVQIDSVNNSIKSFNQTIENLAFENDLAIFITDDFLKPATEMGVTNEGVLFTTEFVTGNTFGLDGIHLTPQGNALFTHYLIDRINKKYQTTIPYPSPSQFPSIEFPN